MREEDRPMVMNEEGRRRKRGGLDATDEWIAGGADRGVRAACCVYMCVGCVILTTLALAAYIVLSIDRIASPRRLHCRWKCGCCLLAGSSVVRYT